MVQGRMNEAPSETRNSSLLTITPSEVSKFYKLVSPILPTPPLGQDMTQGQFLSGV